MSDTRANIEVTASSNRLAAGLRAAMARVQTFSRGVGASMKRVGESAVGTAIGNVAGNLAGRGIDFVTDQAKSVVDFEDKLTRLQINAGKTSVEMDAFRQKARKLSTEVGLSANEILEGTVAYVDLTGDVNGAGDAMGSFARIAQASGSSVADISTAAAALKQSFNLDPKQIENTFSGMIAQGKAGAVTLKDFAGQLSSLAPKWAKFNEASSEKGIAEFGAAFQVARQGFGSAAEAATGMEALMGGLVTHAKDLRKFGKIDVFEHHKDGSKSLKTFEQILASIEKSKLVKDPELMGKALGGRKEATDTLNVLLRARANLTATGNEYTDLVAKGMDYGSSTRDLVTYLDSSSGKMKVTWQTLQDSIAQALTPDRIQSFTEAIEKAVAALGPLLTGLGKIGDFLGGLKKAGSDIRGAITGEGHMTTMDTVRAMAGDDQASLKKANVMAASRYTAIRAADSPLARQKLGIKAESSLELARQYANAQGPGAAAKRAAAKKYFKESGQKADDWEVAGGPSTGPANPAALMKIGLDLLGELKKITGNTKGAGKAEVKIENNTVARANKKATDPARETIVEIAGYVQATWGRLTLWVAKLEGDGSRSLVVHDPSRGDDHAVDDRGSRAERTRLSLLFDDMTGEAEAPIVRFNRLRSQVKALSSMSTPPIFQHPLGEVFPARVGEFTYAIDEHSNVSDVVIEFYPDGDVQAVSPAGAGVAGISGEGAVSQAADDLDAAVSAAGLDAVTVTADARAAQSSWTAGETVPTRQVLVDTADLTEQLATMIDELGLEDDLELWDVYLATIMLADAVRSAAIAATSEVPSVFVFQVAQPVALFALMALLYGGAEAEDRARQAEELNDIRTPGWLEPGPLLLPTRRASAEF